MDQVVDGETGLLVEQRDVARLAEAMVRLAGDPDLRMRLGANGRRRMEAEYDSGAQTAKLEKVLLDAITRHCA